MKTLNEIDKHFKELIAKDEKIKVEVEKQIEETNSKLEEANQRLQVAEDKGNTEDYINIKKEIENLNIINEMNRNKLDKVNNKPLIEKADLIPLLNNIEAIADAEQEKLLDEAKKVLLELKKVADKSLELIGQTNELYGVLFNDIVKDDQSYKRDENNYILWFDWPDYSQKNKVFVYSYYEQNVKNTYMNPEKEVK
ncbi:hypothetical protein DIX90_09600 [Streptococcus iniae]|uniref:hypothetical protein n=1 Tax=Streptococcus iniae TaxID=1346 RepID=UPI000EF6A429|nr:hypothetical protein [Streptococcus iniae]RLU51864.1 hypothetical protein DIY04_10025 [Streptococcus iniae]RLU58094.1 hypothetical protein DIY02_09815 [Streptococcus iniae]RLU60064.1 hypothetical protein DIY01_09635 [Streptococcus iniae]RLU68343.1 hypothetical protein DIX97_09835 [Streptococcus iniae]RLU82376.1 hypothetical protein DIX91_09610 [Streptococcus iniae]